MFSKKPDICCLDILIKIRDSLDETTKQEITSKPIVDFLENLLYTSILRACDILRIPLVQKSYWPDNKSFAVCLTHDVDELKKTYQYITRSVFCIMRGDIKGFKIQLNSFFQKMKGIEPYWTFEDIIAIEKTFQAKSTYFILKESGKPLLFSRNSWSVYGRNRSFKGSEMQTLIQVLKANSDEIGIHGSFFSHQNPELLMEETRELEQIIGNTIIGTRQHHLHLDIPKTWEYQVKAGLKYDSSLGFNFALGFRWGTSYPFFPHNGKDIIPLLEIPLIIMDNYLQTFKNKEKAWLCLTDEVKRYQGVLTLLWHPRNFNPNEYPGLRDLYLKINQYCQEKEAWITCAKDIYNWLSIRNQQAFSCCYHDSLVTIIPSGTNSELFFTVYLPNGINATIRSENIEIIARKENYIYIKSHNLSKNNKIVVDIV